MWYFVYLTLEGKLTDGKNQVFMVSTSKSMGLSEECKPDFQGFSINKSNLNVLEKEQMALVFFQ